MEFIERIEELCKEKHISKRKLEREAGLGAGSSSKWKMYTPNNATMSKIAEYFGVSISYLSGQSDFRNEHDAMVHGWMQENDQESLADETKRFEAGCRIPVLGTVPCGVPMEAVEDVLDWEEIPLRMSKTGVFFGLRVKGDSMSPRIQEGDILIVKQVSDAESGDVVIAKVNGDDACCKKLIKQDGGIVLQSFNPSYAPMFFSNQEIMEKPVQIVGKVVENRQKF